MPQTIAEKKSVQRERRRERGYVLKQLWTHPDDWPAIHDLAKRLERRREKETAKT